jgi:hypothetical protein
MSGTKRTFEVISEREIPDPAPVAAPSAFTAANANILLVSLGALSKRVAWELMRLSHNLFTGGLVVLVWLLLGSVLPSPTSLQLIGVAGFSAFCLMIEIVRRRN